MPGYVGPEFAELWAALEAYGLAEGSEEESDREVTWSAVRSAAYKLASCVQVATAQLKGMSAVDLLLASHYRMAEENLALREQVGEMVSYMEAMSEAQEAMAAQLAVLVAGRDTEGSRGGRGGRRGGRGGRGGGQGGGLGGTVGGGSESDLSSVPDNLSGDEMEF